MRTEGLQVNFRNGMQIVTPFPTFPSVQYALGSQLFSTKAKQNRIPCSVSSALCYLKRFLFQLSRGAYPKSKTWETEVTKKISLAQWLPFLLSALIRHGRLFSPSLSIQDHSLSRRWCYLGRKDFSKLKSLSQQASQSRLPILEGLLRISYSAFLK